MFVAKNPLASLGNLLDPGFSPSRGPCTSETAQAKAEQHKPDLATIHKLLSDRRSRQKLSGKHKVPATEVAGTNLLLDLDLNQEPTH